MLRTNYWLLTIAILAVFTPASAQRTCGAQIYRDQKIKEVPNYGAFVKDQEEMTQKRLESSSKTNWESGILKIPVVVHLIGDDVVNSSMNTSHAQVYQQIEILNNDYRRKIGTSGFGNGFDVRIEFCLATKGPDGFVTSGITLNPDQVGDEYPEMWRPFNTDPNRHNDRIKSIVHWDPEKYLNLYVVNDMEFWDSIDQRWVGLLGYATFPDDMLTKPNDDGVVINFGSFGYTNDPNAGLGRTATHEVGHWLNLRHVWSDGDCSVDDGVGDTPICENSGPNGSILTNCASVSQCFIENQLAGSSSLRPIENYMDYSDDPCVNAFSLGQVQRMHDAVFQFRNLINYYANELVSCYSDHCSNGVLDPGETGIDCGGPDCVPCSNGGVTLGVCEHGASFIPTPAGSDRPINPLKINGSSAAFVIACDKKPFWSMDCELINLWLPNKDVRIDRGAECSSVCYDDILKPKCKYHSVFFAIQKSDFDKTLLGTEYSRYFDATSKCESPYFPKPFTTGGRSLSWRITDFTSQMQVPIENNVLYKVKLGGMYYTGWGEKAAFFYSIGDEFRPDNGYTLSKGFGRRIIVDLLLDNNVAQEYIANEQIVMNPGTIIEVNGQNTFKSFQIAGFDCKKGHRRQANGSENKISESEPQDPFQDPFKFIMNNNQLSVYPNPITSESASVSSLRKIERIELSSISTNANGLIIGFNYVNENEVEIEIPSYLANGVFYLKIRHSYNTESVEKIILMR